MARIWEIFPLERRWKGMLPTTWISATSSRLSIARNSGLTRTSHDAKYGTNGWCRRTAEMSRKGRVVSVTPNSTGLSALSSWLSICTRCSVTFALCFLRESHAQVTRRSVRYAASTSTGWAFRRLTAKPGSVTLTCVSTTASFSSGVHAVLT